MKPDRAGQLLAADIDFGYGNHRVLDRAGLRLSAGEVVALLARAMIQGARMLIMDEPMSGLDYGRQMQLLQHLGSLARDGYAVLLTTHHPEQALLAASRVAVLIDGRIVADGAAEVIVTPQMIRTLYGVEVAAYRSPAGHVAFHPVDGEAAAGRS